MKDSPAKFPIKQYTKTFLTRAVTIPELRDESICQILKQVSDNPVQESVLIGWRLMSLLLSCISPSSALEPCLINALKTQQQIEKRLLMSETSSSSTSQSSSGSSSSTSKPPMKKPKYSLKYYLITLSLSKLFTALSIGGWSVSTNPRVASGESADLQHADAAAKAKKDKEAAVLAKTSQGNLSANVESHLDVVPADGLLPRVFDTWLDDIYCWQINTDEVYDKERAEQMARERSECSACGENRSSARLQQGHQTQNTQNSQNSQNSQGTAANATNGADAEHETTLQQGTGSEVAQMQKKAHEHEQSTENEQEPGPEPEPEQDIDLKSGAIGVADLASQASDSPFPDPTDPSHSSYLLASAPSLAGARQIPLPPEPPHVPLCSFLVPQIVCVLCNAFELPAKTLSKEVVALFSAPANTALIAQVKQTANEGNYFVSDWTAAAVAAGECYEYSNAELSADLRGFPPVCVAALVKSWLKGLTEPLIPRAIHGQLLNAASAVEACNALEKYTANMNFYTIKYLVRFFRKMASDQVDVIFITNVTQMAHTFAPLLFQPEVDAADNMEDFKLKVEQAKRALQDIILCLAISPDEEQRFRLMDNSVRWQYGLKGRLLY
eukprot:MONOS_13051.1-p1 / transcript=MONOS_13051.1 / gene=MONOS_13051 / organism=Monocercomonoides_exilis_PA203 / gene_product=unspecified product / transcript_product=unspecified product / location=Mono_scaffold00772:4831-6863(+) / protein_length=611 / sequence_SO=supercontig / SO=protein_coding / is_pseudo=false